MGDVCKTYSSNMVHLVGLIQSLIGVEKHCPFLSMTRLVHSPIKCFFNIT